LRMLEKLKIKRDYLLIVGGFLLLLLCYQLAIKRTIEAWHQHQQLKKQVARSADLSYQPGYLERKRLNLDKILRHYNADTTNLRSNLLSNISSIAEEQNVVLSEVPGKDASFNRSPFSLEKLSFEGDYFALLKTLNKLQSTVQAGIIRSVSLHLKKNMGNIEKENSLVMDVYFIFD